MTTNTSNHPPTTQQFGPCGVLVQGTGGFTALCDSPATGWHWHQNVKPDPDHLSPACAEHENEGGRQMRALLISNELLRMQVGDLEGIVQRLCPTPTSSH